MLISEVDNIGFSYLAACVNFGALESYEGSTPQ